MTERLGHGEHVSAASRVFRKPCSACQDCTVRKQAICGALADDEVGAMEAILSNASLEPNQTLVSEGLPRARVYSLTGGVMRLSNLLPDGRRQITGFLYPGDYFGLADDQTYSQTAEAVTPAQLCSFPVKQMDELMERFPKLKDRLFKLTREALSSARESQIMLGRLAPVEKVASFLLLCSRRAELAGKPVDLLGKPIDLLDLPMTRIDIADYLGLTIETVSRSFTKLKSQNLIQLPDPHHVKIVDLRALGEVAGWRA